MNQVPPYTPTRTPRFNAREIERVKKAVKALEAAEAELVTACIAAYGSGWSYNYLGDVTGRSFHTVKNMVQGSGRYESIVKSLVDNGGTALNAES
jgi:hypothetical protein